MHYLNNTISLKEFEEALLDFGEAIQSPSRRLRFFNEYNLFKKNDLMQKLATAHKVAQMLHKSSIHTGTLCYSTMPSYLYYVLNITKTNPISHELFPELIIDNTTQFMPIDFQVGLSEKDRLLSILKEIYQATNKLVPPQNSKNRQLIIESLLFPTIDSSEIFHTSAYTKNITPANAKTIANNSFRFFLDIKTDIIESTLKRISKNNHLLTNRNSIPLEDKTCLSNWNLLKDAMPLAIEEEIDVIKVLQSLDSENFEHAVSLTAIYKNRLHNTEHGSLLLGKKRSNAIQPAVFSYYCMGLLEETQGILLYEEQLCHILHYLAQFDYIDTIRTISSIRNNDTESLKYDLKQFLEGATKRGIESQKAERIFSFLTDKKRNLVSKRDAINLLLPLYQINFLKTHFKDEYKYSLEKYGQQNSIL